ncbi:hypothetical protein [Thermosporothrix hazakensis]|jgi:hypothetical protein|nr:hypothetical protein [Thermosporothrix hazakensis]
MDILIIRLPGPNLEANPHQINAHLVTGFLSVYPFDVSKTTPEDKGRYRYFFDERLLKGVMEAALLAELRIHISLYNWTYILPDLTCTATQSTS